MVAIFTGSGTGLENGSGSVLGGAGLLGQSSLGRAGESLFFNAANGNLVISQQDEFLVGRGPDIGISRTYNSQGNFSDENGDNWRQSTDQRVYNVQGTLNTPSSYVHHIGRDGSDHVYVWDASKSAYIANYGSSGGSGSYDKLVYGSNSWTWTDGDTQQTQKYSGHGVANSWRITEHSDTDGNKLTYTYSGTKLDKVTTADGAYTQYSWSGNNITKITTGYTDLATSTAKTLTRTYYGYDASNRLTSVTTDLSPQNNSIADGKTYVTTYTYDGTSKRVASISQTDGSKLEMQYELIDGDYKVVEFKQTVAAGETRTTSIGYGVNVTSVTDPTNQVTKFYYDAKGQLVQLISPPASRGGVSQVTQFEYDANGNVIRTIETDSDNASAANNLVKTAGWGDGEVAGRGENLVDDSGWPQDTNGTLPANGTIGPGWTGTYTGETDWVVTTGPYGGQIVSMHAGQEDAGTPGGGASSDSFDIDKSKAYEFTLYFKADELNKHRAYFGLGSGVVKNGHNDLYNGNPYFTYDYPTAATGIEAGKWYKIVGYVMPEGSANQPTNDFGGVYDIETGEKVRDINHFIWDGSQSGTTTHTRFFNYYNNEHQGKFTHFYKPEVREVSDIAILHDGEKLDIERDANLLKTPLVDGWRNNNAFPNDNEARWTEVIGPEGARQVALQTGEFDGTSTTGHDGGGNFTNLLTIDGTKTYKFTQYVRKSDLDNHNIYFGLSTGAAATPYVKYGSNGNDATNPYFLGWAAATQQAHLDENKWYKIVGYVLPEGSANQPTNDLGGVYDAETGARVASISNNFRWHENRPNDLVHARFFNYYDQTQHGWSTEWAAPEVVQIDNADLAADNADPFGINYDSGGRETHFEYDAGGNVTKVTDPNGNVTTRTYDANNKLLTETVTGTDAATTVTENLKPDITSTSQWYDSNSTRVAAPDINGQKASKFTISAGATYGRTYSALGAVKAGDTITYRTTVQAVGGITTHMMGISGTVSSWGNSSDGESVGYILDGPGEIVQSASGYWYISGLSETEATTVELRQSFDVDQSVHAQFWINYPADQPGDQVILAAPSVTILRKENAAAKTELTTRYAYDSENHLRFAVSAEGSVTEYRYLANGQLFDQIEYPEHEYPIGAAVLTEATMNAWRDGLGDRSSVKFLRYHYDARGNAYLSTNYGGADVNGNGTGANGASHSQAHYTYDQSGNLLQRNNLGEQSERFVYDGMNRLIGSADLDGGVTTIYFNDAATQTTVRLADGAATTSTYNKAGELISYNESDVGYLDSPQATDLLGWATGRVSRTAASAINNAPAYKYTVSATGAYGYTYGPAVSAAAGETVSYRITVKGDGPVNSHRIGLHGSSTGWGTNGSISAIIVDGPGELNQHAGALWDISGLSSTEETTIEIRRTYDVAESARGYFYVGGTGSNVAAGTSVILSAPSLTRVVTNATLGYDSTSNYVYDRNGQLRMETDATNFKTYHLYDKQGRKIADINNGGQIVEYRYGSDGRVAATVRWALGLTTEQLTSLSNPDNDIELDDIRPASHSYDIWEWNVYDSAGRVIQTIDGTGGVSKFEYDNADRLIRTISYYNKLTATQLTAFRADAPEHQILPASHAKDAISRTFYDRDGRVIGSLDGEGYLTRSYYDKAGQLIRQSAYSGATSTALRSSGTLNELYSSITLNSGRDLMTRNVYDGQGLLRYSVDADNFVTSYSYNNARRQTGSIVHAVQIASTSDYTFDSIKAKVAAIANTGLDRMSWNIYNTLGQLAYTSSALGEVTQFKYDNLGQVIKTTRFALAAGVTPTLPTLATMDAWAATNGSASGNRITRNWYVGQGELRYSLDSEGYRTRYDYDAAGRLIREIRWANKITANDTTTIAQIDSTYAGTWVDTKYTYDANGRQNSVYDGEGNRTVFSYHASGLLAFVYNAYSTDDLSLDFKVYDGAGRVYYESGAYGQPERANTFYYYDGLGNLTSVKDPNDNTTTYTYDKRGNMLTATDAEGGVTSYQYDAFGNAVKVTDPEGGETYNYYDSQNRLIRTRDAEDYVTVTNYNVFGEVSQVRRYYNKANNAASVTNITTVTGHSKDALTNFTYDRLGRVTRTTDAQGFYENYTLDAFGNRVSVRNKLGGVITNAYDKRGLLISETLPMSSVNSAGTTIASSVTNKFEYDARGNRTEMIEAFGLAEQRTTTYVYDKADRLVETIGETVFAVADNLNTGTNVPPTETIIYDKRGNIVETIDANGARTLFYYNDLNRKVAEINALGTLSTHVYDKNGNVTSSRVYGTTVSLPATASGIAPTGTGTYRETTFTYDKRNLLLTSSTAGVRIGVYNGSVYNTWIVTITATNQYDANGNLVKQTDANGSTYSYYDDLNRKIGQVDQEKYVTRWTYDSEGNVTREVRYAVALTGTVTTNLPANPSAAASRLTDYTYDKVGNRLTEARMNVLTHNGSGGQTNTAWVTISYTYNGLGQVTSKTEATGDTTSYSYDQTGRLTLEQKAAFDDYRLGTTSVTPTTDYYYDGLNNLSRTRQHGTTGTPERVATYTYGLGGRLASMTDASGFTRSYQYDAKGQVKKEFYKRYASDGTSWDWNAVATRYDLLGRTVLQALARGTSSAGSFVFDDVTNIQYNAYGDVSARGINGLQEQFHYDNAGRLWKSNSGDGTWKYFGYDAGGNQTIAIASAGANLTGKTLQQALALPGQSDVNATYTQYDKRGQALSVVEEGRQLRAGVTQNLTSSRSYNAFGEVLSETDALGHTTNYTYNNMGRVIKKESPYVSVTSASGAVSNVRPTENYYYDASGRLVANRDANNNLTRLTLLAGTGYDGGQALVTQELHADGGIRQTKYDRHGNARIMIDEVNRTTTQSFDAMGRVTQITKPGGLNTYYSYDGLGQRLSEYNSVLGSGNKQTTDYDTQGRVISTRAFGGDVTTTTYTWNAGIDNVGMGLTNVGGWTQTVSTAADRVSTGDTLYATTETSDLFGHMITRSDVIGQTYNYVYDIGGRMTSETSTLAGGAAYKNNAYSYFNTGQINTITSGNTPVANTNWTRTIASYGYDALGRLTAEKLVAQKGTYTPEQIIWLAPGEPEVIPASYTVTNTTRHDGHGTYDAAGRMTRYYDDAVSGAHNVDKTWAYDAGGNVRKISSTYRPVNANGTLATTTAVQEFWYAFDNMNRTVVSKGQLVSGQIVRGATSTATGTVGGIDILYNKAGERVETTATEEFINPYTGSITVDTVEAYTYNADGQITLTKINNVNRATTSFDLLGRVNGHAEYSTAGALVHNRYALVYDARNQVIAEKGKTKQGANWIHTHTVNNYSANGLGANSPAITSYGQVGSSSGTLLYFSETKNWTSTSSALPGYLSSADYAFADAYTRQTYRWNDGAQQANVNLINRDGTSNSGYAYDKNDHLTSVSITGGNRPRTIYFGNNRDGQVITRSETDNNYSQNDPSQRTYFFGGKQMGTVGNDGTGNVDYEQSITDRTTVQGTGAFRNGAINGSLYADFDANYNAINGNSQQDSSNLYTARGGESLSQVAAAVWGDSSLWYKLAEANGLTGSETLTAGRTLTIPNTVSNASHNANTFKVYDPAKAIGDTSPNTPQPPKQSNKCGAFGQILVSAIAIAVVALTQQYQVFAALGPVLGGAASGVAASVASQGVGVATGIQDKFSFKGVAIAAIAGGVGGALGPGGSFGADGAFGNLGSEALTAGLRGAASSAITQGISAATGLQNKFSFAGVAAAGIGAGVGAELSGALGLTGFDDPLRGLSSGNFAGHALSGTANAIANAATRSALTGSSFGDNIMRALPDAIGSTIGNALAGAVGGGGAVSEAALMNQAQEAFRELVMTTEGQALLTRAGFDPSQPPTPQDLVNYLSRRAHNFTQPNTEAIDKFRQNIALWVDDARISASGLPGADNASIALAQNTALQLVYSSIASVVPDFQWTYVGGFVANQVRGEIERLGAIEDVASLARHLPFSGSGPLSKGGSVAINHAIDTLIAGQVSVVTDIGSYALAYNQFGAEAVANIASNSIVQRAFTLQAQADSHLAKGNFQVAADLGTDAAILLGVHEQRRLEDMWKDPIIRSFAQGGDLFGLVETDIQTAIGTIQTPGNLAGDGPWDLSYRIGIAENAFRYMNRRVFAPSAESTTNRNTISEYFGNVWTDGGVRWADPQRGPI